MAKVIIDVIEIVVECISVCGLIFGNTYVRIACGFLAIGYKLAKMKLDIRKIK